MIGLFVWVLVWVCGFVGGRAGERAGGRGGGRGGRAGADGRMGGWVGGGWVWVFVAGCACFACVAKTWPAMYKLILLMDPKRVSGVEHIPMRPMRVR